MLTLTAGVYSLMLPNPKLNNIRHLSTTAVIKRTMANKIWAYRKGVNKRKLVFDLTINATQKANLLTFINNIAGADITLTDWNSVTYTVKLVSNPLNFEESRHNALDSVLWNVTLEFEGV
jgi:hypothetical protein